MWKEETSTEARARQVHSIKGLHTVRESYSRTSTNGRLSTTATLFGGQVIHWLLFKPFYKGHFFGGHTIHWLLLKPLYNGRLPTTAIFLADIPYIDSCLNLSTTAVSLQRPLFLEDMPYIDSCLNLSTTATFFCPQGGRCQEAQLYRPPNSERGDSPLTLPLQPNP